MFIDAIETRGLSLVTVDGDKVVTLSLSGNNEHPQRMARLNIGFEGDYPSEIVVDPGPLLKRKPGIVSEIMQLGPRTADGKGRVRITTSINCDSAGGLHVVIDSSTNDPSGSTGQAASMPMTFNAGEAVGVYVTIYPSDRTIRVQDRVAGEDSGRVPAAELAKRLRELKP